MLKKHLLLVMLLVMTAFCADASTWKMHDYYVTSKIQNIFDTGDKVYYLNSNHLFRFDKTTGVTDALNKQNLLSDARISQIYYDWENQLLFIAYANSNIDVINNEGKVTNIPNLKNRVTTVQNYSLSAGELSDYATKGIRDITFGNGIAYVAVGYGFFMIDENTLRVVKNYQFTRTICVNSVALVGETLMIFSNGRCYYGEPGDPEPTKNYQSITGSFSNAKSYPINDHSVFVYGVSAGILKLDISSGTPVSSTLLSNKATSIQKTTTGFIANFAGAAYYYSFNQDGESPTKEATVITCASSNPSGDGTIWVVDANGLHIKGNTTYYKKNSLTFDSPYWLKYNGVLNKLYVGSSGPNKVNVTSTTVTNYINTYDGVKWSNATAYSATGAGYDFVFNPNDPHTYLRTSWAVGIFKVTDDVRKLTYTTSNSLIGMYKPQPAFDNYGNLWVVSALNAAANPCTVLPKNKVASNSVAKTDWFKPSGLGGLNTGSIQRSRFLVSHKNNYKIFSDCDYPSGAVVGHVLCWDNGNEDPTVDTYQFASVINFVDQDNRLIKWDNLFGIEEDRDGLIWIGFNSGLFVVDPDVLFDELPRVTRPYVSKFIEGQGYLCDSYIVYDIGVDRDNNKWIATNNGLYYSSADGSEVFNHFTPSNSDIPSNVVYSVECDTINDRIYIVTDNGFAEYVPEGDAAALNFDNVYAFPDPVEPDFTGMVKIANLMDNSYVTVTDRNGTVVAQFGPVMGSALWDGSGADGERVPTGVYNIYAAQGSYPVTTGTPHATVKIIK
jgi:hypothetical protein